MSIIKINRISAVYENMRIYYELLKNQKRCNNVQNFFMHMMRYTQLPPDFIQLVLYALSKIFMI